MRGDSQKRIEKCVFSFLFAAVVFVEETRLPVTHTKKNIQPPILITKTRRLRLYVHMNILNLFFRGPLIRLRTI
jgi:hypothetical protein